MIATVLAAPARLLAALLSLLMLAACSGGVSGPAPVNDPNRITILPATATLYSGVPTTFTISGGTGSYIVSSSNQTVVPISGSISGNSLVVTPNHVGADTTVSLTVRDTGTTPTATATLTVRPGTVSNEVTVTATSTQGLACAPAICSGGDAEVAVNLSQAGAPLVGRTVRFDALTGDYRFITSTSGSSIEILQTSASVVTDQTGSARARIRVLANAANQTALLQATDTTSGAFQRTSFAIAQATGTSPGFFASPSAVTFQGIRVEECAGSNISAMFYVFGGTPPYVVSNTLSTLNVRPEILPSSGSSFTVTPTGACIGLPGVPIVIRDAAGRTTTVNVANIPGTTAVPALSASPATINLTSCDASANIQVAGGRSGTYFVASGSDALVATISGSTVTVRRRNPSGPAAASGTIGISDGTSVVNVSVTLSGAALGACPSPVFAATPTTVTLTDCSTGAQVFLSGGSGTYTAASSSGAISTSITGSVLTIRRTSPSGAFTTGTVTVSDGITSKTITVNATGAGAAACGAGGALTATPTTVTLTDCSSAAFVSVTGASGTLSVASSSPSVSASVSGSLVTIRRTTPSAAFGGGTVVISDSAASVTITVAASGAGAGACSSPSQPITATPSSVTLTDCSGVVQTTLSGGSGSYSAAASSGSFTASVSGNILSVRRVVPSGAFSGGTVTISDGTSTMTVPVNATGAGAGSCGSGPTAVTTNPTSVTLSGCSTTEFVQVSGGSGSYSAVPSTGALTASISGSVLSIRRTNPSSAFTSGTITVSDGTSSAVVTVSGSGEGSGACPTPVAASPSTVTLTDCSSAAVVTISGGSGNYTATPSSTSLTTSVSGNVLSIRRTNPSSSFAGGTVTVSDGSTTTTISVNATGSGAGACPTTGQAFAASPTAVQLDRCDATATVNLSGGSGNYSAASQSASLTASVSGSVVTIRRAIPSSAFSSGSVIVSDGSSNITINVTGVGEGAGACSSSAPISASPQNVELTSCTSSPSVVISGGSGTLSASASDTGIQLTSNGNILTISRRPASPAITSNNPCTLVARTGTQCVTVSDGVSSTQIGVALNGTSDGACP